jgi:hypothetical protein
MLQPPGREASSKVRISPPNSARAAFMEPGSGGVRAAAYVGAVTASMRPLPPPVSILADVGGLDPDTRSDLSDRPGILPA